MRELDLRQHDGRYVRIDGRRRADPTPGDSMVMGRLVGIKPAGPTWDFSHTYFDLTIRLGRDQTPERVQCLGSSAAAFFDPPAF